MADDLKQTASPAGTASNISKDYEVRDWAKSLDVSEDELRNAVAKIGPIMVKDVKAHLQLRD